jgi:hypothetical protein
VCLFPLYWIAICAFKEPAAVADSPSYLPFVDFKPTLSLFDASDDTLRRFATHRFLGTGARQTIRHYQHQWPHHALQIAASVRIDPSPGPGGYRDPGVEGQRESGRYG